MDPRNSLYCFIPLFRYDHLPDHVQKWSKPFCDLALKIIFNWPVNRETTTAVRKLLEAKDCGVRGASFANKPVPVELIEEMRERYQEDF